MLLHTASYASIHRISKKGVTREEGGTNEFVGCKAAEVTGASKRIVLRRSPITVENAAEERSQMITFQSREAVRR